MKLNMKFGISALLAAMLLVSMVFVPTVSAETEKPSEQQMPEELKQWIKETHKDEEKKLWMKEQTEKWMQDHTINVTSTKTFKYENGELIVKETTTGEELEEKFKVDKTTQVRKYTNLRTDSIKVSSNDKTFSLNEGDEITTTTTTTIVMTYATAPFPWWDYGYEYPQYTWYYVGGYTYDYYKLGDPVNIAWENTYKSTVESRIMNEGWDDIIFEWAEYVSDPHGSILGNPAWIRGDGVAESMFRINGGFHVRLFDMSNGDVVGGAHEDSAGPEHVVIGIENAEDLVAGFFDNDMSN